MKDAMNLTLNKQVFYKNLIDNLYDGVYFVDADRLITYWNKGAERITGRDAGDMIGKFCHANLLDHITDSGRHLCKDGCPLLETIRDGQLRESEVFLLHADGYRVPVLVRTSPMYDEHDHIVGAVEVFSNNQSLLKMRERVDQLEDDLTRDVLTGLGNRVLLKMKIGAAVREFYTSHASFGLLFMDIDRFKAINDTHGHHAGDQVLQATAKNMASQLRSSDVCGRWGGEEFIALLYNMNRERFGLVADKVRATIDASPVVVDGTNIPVTISIGAVVMRETDTMESLIQRADELMYQSKQAGRNCVTVEA